MEHFEFKNTEKPRPVGPALKTTEHKEPSGPAPGAHQILQARVFAVFPPPKIPLLSSRF